MDALYHNYRWRWLDKNDVRMGYVANKTTIFDYILLQPGYYWDTEIRVPAARYSLRYKQ